MAKERQEIEEQSKWNVEALYPDLGAWERELSALIKGQSAQAHWPHIHKYRDTIGSSPKTLYLLLGEVFKVERALSKLYIYAHLRHDEDIGNETYKAIYDRIWLLLCDFQSEISWITPEILQLPKETFHAYLNAFELKEYEVYLKRLIPLRLHTLSANEELLLSQAKKPLQSAERAFQIFNNSDLQFGKIANEKGETFELTQGTYHFYLQSQDRTLRKNAFLGLHRRFQAFQGTLSELLNGQVQKNIFESKMRRYPSALHAALTPHQIDVQVYHTLIETVRKNLSVLHKYISLRKTLLNAQELHVYDLYVSPLPKFEKTYSYAEAVELILEAVSPLGKAYQKVLEEGLGKQRWVDRYENVKKRSGAYSSGCYDSFPYILLNYQGTLNDVMTLCHEAGHSMHSFYSNQNQPFHSADYPIFLAEVASTFHEELLFRHLMERADTSEERCYLLNQKMDAIRATLFRQTQFAEFELMVHTLAENGRSLTPFTLTDLYQRLNVDYYGDNLTIDPESAVECLRIPHFYTSFYVYQYATGISAAYALVEKLIKEGEKGQRSYLQFLSSGSSSDPLQTLERAGVNMKESASVQGLIDRFEELLGECQKEWLSCSSIALK